jgi:hypothetical protein
MVLHNIAIACLIIAGVVIVAGLSSYIFSPAGGVNVVNLRGCVLPQYQANKTEIMTEMQMRGWTDEMISQSFNCY